ncbi:MAG: demethylmenaquinone methyltransferase [Paenibacillaceae bacterium]|jgi:ubiquinone/menaquinone biosynthesis C-methylase UbiE|nr:demethylmenaquinone methyltransferase [Paenibacillaceae bacterium]
MYEQLISRQPSLLPAVNCICPVEGLDIVDAGAGTGRLAAALGPHAASIVALDQSEAMLQVTAAKLDILCPGRWRCIPADNRSLPLPDHSADLVVSGWSVCYVASSSHADWSGSLGQALSEFTRILRPGGTIILFETMGTGTEQPAPPDFLLPYYRELQERYGFAHRTMRLDYSFRNVQEAAELTGFFFGENLARRVATQGLTAVPEFAGVWWIAR